MKKYFNKKTLLGITLIVLALYVVASKLTVLPEISIVSIIFSLVFLAWAVDGIINREYVSITLPLALICCQYDDFLGITAVTPWTLLICAVAVGIGLDIVFGSHKHHKGFNFNGKGGNTFNVTDENVYAENNLGENVHYAYCNNLKEAHIENNLGSVTVYLTDCIVNAGGARVSIENNLGGSTVYIPKSWNLSIHKDADMGNVDIQGVSTGDSSQPVVDLDIECNMGNVVVILQ